MKYCKWTSDKIECKSNLYNCTYYNAKAWLYYDGKKIRCEKNEELTNGDD